MKILELGFPLKDDQCKKINQEKLYKILQEIPTGKVSTYKELAKVLESKAYRAIGQILKNNPNPPKIPCHRIVAADGKIGGYVFGKQQKIALLRKEGILVKNDKICNFSSKLFTFS